MPSPAQGAYRLHGVPRTEKLAFRPLDLPRLGTDNRVCSMNFRNWLLIGFASALAIAQQPAPVQANPAPGCSAAAAQLEANKRVALAFFPTRGADRVALADP